jgi:uncharacterized protein YdeI (YjbR/CyaY-like superfamily)
VTEPTFFESPAAFREWLERHRQEAQELWVGFYKVGSGRPSITWPESVDEALCFGWIDGVRHRIDDASYKIRFTPRRKGSVWSAVNTRRAEELIAEGRMRPAGLAAFQERPLGRAGSYSYEQRTHELDEAYEARLRAEPAAWEYFSSRPPWYRRSASWWIMSAKREETRLKRLATLIAESAAGRDVPPLARGGVRSDA